jgi:hypothetical protein
MSTSPDIAFLKTMDQRAKAMEQKISDPDHWAKPYYSDVNTFVNGVPTALVGLNPAGDRYSHQLNKEDSAEERTWSGDKPFHNAYLDERWGTRSKGVWEPGCAQLQVAVQQVYASIFGDTWCEQLRETACFNLIPVSSRNTRDPTLKSIRDEGVAWGIELLNYLKPKLIILNGNSKTNPGNVLQSAWVELCDNFAFVSQPQSTHLEPRRYSIKHAVLGSGPLKDTRVIALPHLSRAKDPWHPGDKDGYNRRALLKGLKGGGIHFQS